MMLAARPADAMAARIRKRRASVCARFFRCSANHTCAGWRFSAVALCWISACTISGPFRSNLHCRSGVRCWRQPAWVIWSKGGKPAQDLDEGRWFLRGYFSREIRIQDLIKLLMYNGDPDWIRTSDLLLRRQMVRHFRRFLILHRNCSHITYALESVLS